MLRLLGGQGGGGVGVPHTHISTRTHTDRHTPDITSLILRWLLLYTQMGTKMSTNPVRVCLSVCARESVVGTVTKGDADIKVAVLFVVWSRSDDLRSRGARSEVTRQLLGAGVLPPDVQHED